MKIRDRFQALVVPEKRDLLSGVGFDRDLSGLTGTFGPSGYSAAGVAVTPDSALRTSAVYGSVRLISDTISTLPVNAFFKNDDGTNTPLFAGNVPVWLQTPNIYQSRISVYSQTMMSLLLNGNAYWATQRDNSGKVINCTVIDPTRLDPVMTPAGLQYQAGGQSQLYSQFEVLHIPGLMKPGTLKGISPIGYAADSIGLSIAAQTYGSRLFSGDGTPALAIEYPGAVTKEAVERIKDNYRAGHAGLENASRIAVLTEGAKYSKISLAPNEAQFLETRAFQISDVARIFGVPPHLLGDASGSTSWGSGLAEQNTAYIQYCLLPHILRVEAALDWLLLSEGRDFRQYVKLDFSSLQRGDDAERYANYAIALNSGFMTINEVRALEDMPPVTDGLADKLRVNKNFMPLTADFVATSGLTEPTSVTS